MEALIIAAGRGSRLNHRCSPKPLTRILGLSLIERVILLGKSAGIDAFRIVVGFQANEIMSRIGHGEKYGTFIDYIYNPNWEKGNGVSLLAARDHLRQPFILFMTDHLFEKAIIKKLMKVKLEEDECVLCIDRNLKGSHFSLDDATKVWIEDGYVQTIGKTIRRYNALDTGIFLCTPIIFEALEHSVANGDYGLSGGNQILSNMGKLKTLDITGHVWVDVDDEVAYQKAKRTLIQGLEKTTDGPIARKINRKLSTPISSILANFNLSPNSLTLVSFVVAFFSALCFFTGDFSKIILAGILAQLSSILDGCDGEIARLKFQHSTFGTWLDKVLDRYADGLILIGITHALWLHTENYHIWLLGTLAIIGTFMNSYTAFGYDTLLKKELTRQPPYLRLGRDVRLFIIFLGALFNQLFYTLALLATVTNAEALRRLFVFKHVDQSFRRNRKDHLTDYISVPHSGRFGTR
ncbi:MAG: CDP-alcohol phosphatidyltransferase family protein [bacterium]